MRISFKCVLNSHVFGIRSSEIACDFRIANEVEMGHKAAQYNRVKCNAIKCNTSYTIWDNTTKLRHNTTYNEMLHARSIQKHGMNELIIEIKCAEK